MINDKNHAELRNKMGPIVTFFELINKINTIKEQDINNILEKYKEESLIVINKNLPRIKEILDQED
jgi:hypothetical protein